MCLPLFAPRRLPSPPPPAFPYPRLSWDCVTDPSRKQSHVHREGPGPAQPVRCVGRPCAGHGLPRPVLRRQVGGQFCVEAHVVPHEAVPPRVPKGGQGRPPAAAAEPPHGRGALVHQGQPGACCTRVSVPGHMAPSLPASLHAVVSGLPCVLRWLASTRSCVCSVIDEPPSPPPSNPQLLPLYIPLLPPPVFHLLSALS